MEDSDVNWFGGSVDFIHNVFLCLAPQLCMEVGWDWMCVCQVLSSDFITNDFSTLSENEFSACLAKTIFPAKGERA